MCYNTAHEKEKGRRSAPKLGRIFHGDRPCCRQAIKLFAATGRRRDRAVQPSHLSRLQRHTPRCEELFRRRLPTLRRERQERRAPEECLCVHAEQNAICQAAYYGHATAGATIYVTISPCLTCAKLIINSGIKEVVYGGDYPYQETVKEMFRQAGVKCRRLD